MEGAQVIINTPSKTHILYEAHAGTIGALQDKAAGLKVFYRLDDKSLCLKNTTQKNPRIIVIVRNPAYLWHIEN
jgi:hypothetical protein